MYQNIAEIEVARNVISPPGDTLAETLEVKGISQFDLAMRMSRPIKTINEIIKGKVAITPETAIQLELVLGIEADFWMEREKRYRLELAEIELAEKLILAKNFTENFPLAVMKKLQWIDYQNNWFSKSKAIFSFFGVAAEESYWKCYHPKVKDLGYHVPSQSQLSLFAMAAWLKQGEHQASRLNVDTYNALIFKEVLWDIRSLMLMEPLDLQTQMQGLCAKAGVKLVFTPKLPKIPLYGSTRWYQGHPLIQLSDQEKHKEHFWFSFFHEAGHILKHGKKDVFFEGLSYTLEAQLKENQANEIAEKYRVKRG